MWKYNIMYVSLAGCLVCLLKFGISPISSVELTVWQTLSLTDSNIWKKKLYYWKQLQPKSIAKEQQKRNNRSDLENRKARWCISRNSYNWESPNLLVQLSKQQKQPPDVRPKVHASYISSYCWFCFDWIPQKSISWQLNCCCEFYMCTIGLLYCCKIIKTG